MHIIGAQMISLYYFNLAVHPNQGEAYILLLAGYYIIDAPCLFRGTDHKFGLHTAFVTAETTLAVLVCGLHVYLESCTFQPYGLLPEMQGPQLFWEKKDRGTSVT